MKDWTSKYTQCYFGFTGLTRAFTSFQIQGLRAVPSDRLLLETDAPHLSPLPGARVNSPTLLGEVGAMVAGLRGVPLPRIMEETTNNARKLYGFW